MRAESIFDSKMKGTDISGFRFGTHEKMHGRMIFWRMPPNRDGEAPSQAFLPAHGSGGWTCTHRRGRPLVFLAIQLRVSARPVGRHESGSGYRGQTAHLAWTLNTDPSDKPAKVMESIRR
jgi:hypothetical protein